PPYNVFYDVNGEMEQTGIVGGFQTAVLRSMNVSYDIVLRGEHGARYPNGTYRGLFGMMQRREVDKFAKTAEPSSLLDAFLQELRVFNYLPLCQRVVEGFKFDISPPFANCLVLKNVRKALTYVFLKLSIILEVWRRPIHQEHARHNQKVMSFWPQPFDYDQFALHAGTYMSLKSDHVRLVFMGWSLGCLLLGSMLSGGIKGSLIVQVPTARINSVKDIVRRDLEDPPMTPYALKMGFLVTAIEESTLEEFQTMHKMLLRRGGYLTNYLDLFAPRIFDAIMAGRAVQIANEATIVEQHAVACAAPGSRFHVGSEPVFLMWLTWYSNRDTLPSRFLIAMAKRTQWLLESGTQFYREEQFVARLRSCVVKEDSSRRQLQEAQQLSLKDIRTAFYLFLTFNATATFVFAVEWFTGRVKNR
ncbi:unnamed protein product, partial [Ixodes hexagonus]